MALRQFSSSFAQGEFQFLIVFPVVIRTFVPVSGMRTGARPPNRECKQFGLLLSMGMFLGPGRNRIQTGARPESGQRESQTDIGSYVHGADSLLQRGE